MFRECTEILLLEKLKFYLKCKVNFLGILGTFENTYFIVGEIGH